MKKTVLQKPHYISPEITVSNIAVNGSEWIFAKHNVTKDQAFDIMQKNKFDILPVREADRTFKKYFKTTVWGVFENNDIRLHEIKPADCLDHHASIKDAIKAFSLKERNFYFLKNEDHVTGLLTAGNLNSKHVYIYLYLLISMLEFELGRLINRSGIDDLTLYKIFEENNKSVKPNTRFRREIKKGLDHKFVEFAYIGDMAWLISMKNLNKKIGITAKEFESSIKLVNKLRNIVAHPVNSLIKGKNSIDELCMMITKTEILTEKIKSYLSENMKTNTFNFKI